jgi:glycosyltransferase involved in cell wall biosynthesis
MDVSVILPVYNECNRLQSCVQIVDDYLSRNYPSYEIIIVEDNSTDNSYAIAKDIASANKNVRLLHNSRRLGRGASLKEAILESRSDIVLYMDVDLATDISYIRQLVDSIKDGASIATGSRLIKDSKTERPLSRDIASRSYNTLTRLMFKSPIYDHQCGFKSFNKKGILPMLNLITDNHWFWDTELLIACQSQGIRITEFPVTWKHNGGNDKNASKVKVVKDSAYMGKRLINLKIRQLNGGLYIKDANFDQGIEGHN